MRRRWCFGRTRLTSARAIASSFASRSPTARTSSATMSRSRRIRPRRFFYAGTKRKDAAWQPGFTAARCACCGTAARSFRAGSPRRDPLTAAAIGARPARDQPRRLAQPALALLPHLLRAGHFRPGPHRRRDLVGGEQGGALRAGPLADLDGPQGARDGRVTVRRTDAFQQVLAGDGADPADNARILVPGFAPARIGGDGPGVGRQRLQAARSTPRDKLRPRAFPDLGAHRHSRGSMASPGSARRPQTPESSIITQTREASGRRALNWRTDGLYATVRGQKRRHSPVRRTCFVWQSSRFRLYSRRLQGGGNGRTSCRS